ncbi:MAG: FtsX-like permease family protein [Bacilli bacterium]|nr:FtsX-like permease family protein [Bacilli bacterium]
MNLLNKLTTKSLKLNKKRTIVTIIGIILSVALLTAVTSMYASGIKSLINFEIKEEGNYHVCYRNVPVEDLYIFKNNRGISNYNVTKNLGYANISVKTQNKPYAFIKQFTKDSLNNLAINLVSGRLPENENEILIPTHLKTNGRNFLNVGDTITLNVGKRVDLDGKILTQDDPYNSESSQEEIIDTISKTYKVVGIMENSSRSIESFSTAGYTFVTFISNDQLSGNVDVYAEYNDSSIKNWTKVTANILEVDENIFKNYVDGNIKNEKMQNKINSEMAKAKYDFIFNEYLIGLETDPIKTSGIEGLGTVLCIVLAIIVFASVFCIKNSFDISITEKIKQYGMLRSIGATKKQIRRNVFYEATILGLIGIPLGLIVGILASFILVIVSNYFLNGFYVEYLKLVFTISPVAILVAIILGIITVYSSAFRAARKASKVSPIDSIKNSGSIKINAQKIKTPKFIRKIFGIGGEISYKNLKRNKKKFRTTVISISVSVFIFIALSSFMSMSYKEVDDRLKVLEYNILLNGSINNNIDRYNKYLETTKLDNINDYTILRFMQYEVKNLKYNKEYLEWSNLKNDDLLTNDSTQYLNIYALGSSQYKKYIKSLGLEYEDIKDKAIVIDHAIVSRNTNNDGEAENKYMRVYDYNPKDVIVNTTHDKTLIVGYVTDHKPFGLKNNDMQYLIVSDEMFDNLMSNKIIDNVSIFYKSSNASKLQDDIDHYLNGDTYYHVDNVEKNAKTMNNIFTLVAIFLYGFIIVISLIGITNIFNTITTNMELRKPEFAMLKSIGMTTKEFNRMIRLETLFMGMKALLIGIPIGVALSYIIYYFLVRESGMPYTLPIVPIIISILVVFILISLIMKYSINKIKKQNTIETIRNENI